MPFIPGTEELPYVSRLAASIVRYANLLDQIFTSHSLHYVTSLHPFDGHHLLTDFLYCVNETVFERRLQLESTDHFFVSSHCVECFGIQPIRLYELFIRVT